MAKWLVLAGLGVWLAATVWAALALYGDVAVEGVALPLADGNVIRGALYSPRGAEGPLPAVVVVHGIAVDHASCGPGLAAPLARNGFLTLAVDVRGHGRSGGTIARAELNDHLAMLDGQAEHPEIDAAIEFLKRDPRVAGPQVAIVGHSRGGWAATNVGCRRDDVAGVVCIGAAPAVCDATRPRNFLLLAGSVEDLCPPRKFCRTVARLTGGGRAASETTFERRGRTGDLGDGTARAWVTVHDANHFTEVADDHITRCTVQWVAASYKITAGPIPEDGLFRLLVGVVVATLGGLLASACLLSQAAERLSPATGARPCRGLARLALFLLLVLLLVPVLAATARPLEAGPVCFAVPAVVLFAALSGLGAAVLGPRQLGEGGLLTQRRATRAGLSLGVLALGLAFLWFGVPWGVTWIDLAPTPPRLLLAVALLVVLFPWGVILARALQRQAAGGFGAALVWAAVPAALVLGHRLFAAEGWPLVAVPVGLFTVGCLVPLPLWFLPERPGLALARGFSHAAGAAWVLACHLPFVHAG